MSDPTTPDGKPVLNDSTIDQARYDAAVNACRQYMPNLDKLPPPMDTETLQMWRAWSECMRTNGVDIEDPQPDDPRPPGIDIPRGTDTAGLLTERRKGTLLTLLASIGCEGCPS
jgi:hypothetical protein